MKFQIITIFPNILQSYFNESLLKRAQENKIIEIKNHDLRKWTTDNHKTVDDTPTGGGPGMIMKIEPLYKAIQEITKTKIVEKVMGIIKPRKKKIVLLSAKGKTWNQALAKEYSKLDELILICGRYEGVDERIKEFIDEEISIGDYVMTGGELGAAVIIDSITRLIPGVLGNEQSSEDESHSEPGILEYPQYTKPEVFVADGKEYKTPDVLMSGNHQKIREWREKQKKLL
ncbi:MAG: tRNA (guanosine(37)-N1)-methyltransferase TrmD [bacterium]